MSDDRVQQVIDELDPTPAHEAAWPVSRRQTLRALAAAGLLGAGSGSASAESAGGVIADEAVFSNYGSESVSDGWELTIDDDVFALTESEDTIGLPDGGVGEEVVLPNGAGASEMIAPDGSVVFEDVGILNSELYRFTESNGWIHDVAFHPDYPNEPYLAGASEDTDVYIWDLSDGSLHATLTDPSGNLISLDWHPSGDWLAANGEYQSGTADYDTYVWDTSDMNNVSLAESFDDATDRPREVEFSSNGQYISYTGEDPTLYIREVGNGWDLLDSVATAEHRSDGIAFSSDWILQTQRDNGSGGKVYIHSYELDSTTTIFDDDFEGDTVGSYPANWSEDLSGASNEVTDTTAVEGSQSFQASGISSSNRNSPDESPVGGTTETSISAALRGRSGTSRCDIRIYGEDHVVGTDDDRLTIFGIKEGNIEYFDGSWNVIVSDVNDSWVKFDADFDFANNQYSLAYDVEGGTSGSTSVPLESAADGWHHVEWFTNGDDDVAETDDWDITGEQAFATSLEQTVTEPDWDIFPVAFDSTKTRFAYALGEGDPGRAEILELSEDTWSNIQTLDNSEGTARGVSWSDDDAYISVSGKDSDDLFVETVADGSLKQQLSGMTDGLGAYGNDWSPDGSLLAYGGVGGDVVVYE